MPKKAVYRPRNWKAYNQSLVQRGSLTVWIEEDVLARWHPEPEGKRKRGGQIQYSEQAIETLLTLRAVYQLPYRQTVGFAQSIFDLMGAGVTVPDYTLLCKRGVSVTVDLGATASDEGKHLVIDSTGLKIYGEGEWKVRQHGYSKRRTWRKLHIGVNAETQQIEAMVLSEAGLDDAEAGKAIVEQTPGEIEQTSADGAYDKRKFYEAATDRGVKQITVPPRKDAKIWQHGNSHQPPLPRDQNLRAIRKSGRKKWKRQSGYHQRSLAETAVYRFKIIFGNTMQTRTLSRQITEARIKVAALNRMTLLGLPDSYRVI